MTRWIPSSSSSLPSMAAVTRGDGLHAVSPLGRVNRCWRRSLAVMSWKWERRKEAATRKCKVKGGDGIESDVGSCSVCCSFDVPR